ncbi:mitochondrial chaperone BCS1-like protein [Cinnamomum micranthum f. kanehirae]|uniref:Mitochondrial chaperone BCS1-like protein n=1 Tax=Cinnamomum micranthum f. kanehirae TaxID=337451 RepID=A0A3S3MUY6_9MAGN|nr:mitochondrial chaperone BCS1-like protein [Cinnamomum micranthum f. kanehirae]
MRSLTVAELEKEKKIKIIVSGDEEVLDKCQGIQLEWRRTSHELQMQHFISSHRASTFRLFELIFHEKHTQIVMDSYLPFIFSETKAIMEISNTSKVHKMQSEDLRGRWAVCIHYPSSNCLGIEDHQLFEEIQKLLMTVEVTPRTYE